MGFFSTLMTNEYNERIADKNLQFQRDTFEYEKALQNQIFNREDTTYQRTVADMNAAGLNPLSMSGTNGAGEAISMESPQNQHRAENADLLGSLSQIFGVLNQFKTMQNNSTLANAQANLLNSQATNQNIKNLYEDDILKLTSSGMTMDNLTKNLENIGRQTDMMFNETYGLSPNMPDWLKQSLVMSKKKGLDFNFSKTWDKFENGSFLDLGNSYQVFKGLSNTNMNNMSTAVLDNKMFGLVSTVLGKIIGGLF